METKLSIPIILGTNREGRKSEYVAKWIHEEAGTRSDIETKLFDVRDFKLPEDDYGQATKDLFPEYRDAVIGCDGLIIVAPEYNHGYPGRLKTVLDMLLPEYSHKAVGLVGVSAGAWGGTRVIEALVNVVRELGLVVTGKDLNVPSVGKMFDERGIMKEENREGQKERLDGFLDELVWMSRALHEARIRENS